jgi:DNA-binding transcriptional LysR family regulator
MARQKEELIELRHLRYFIALAEELHFARAAERLRIEQSPLSRAIRDLESLLGARLFERNTRSTRITRAGRVLFGYARRAIVLVEQAITSTRSAALGYSEQLRIGVSDSTAYCRITEILAHYKSMYPNVSVSLQEMPRFQQIQAIRDDLLDASISLQGGCCDGIETQAIAHNRLCVAFPAAHPLAHADSILQTDLIRYPLILFSPEVDLGAGFQVESFVESFARPHIAFRANSLGTMLSLVGLEHGIGFVGSAQVAGINRSDVQFRPLGSAGPSITTYVLHSDSGVSEPLQAFIGLAREQLASGDSPGAPS